MSDGRTDELAVDVLVIGAGIQGLYVAQSLHERWSVCVLSDPRIDSETLESLGYISAGYDGNDAMRMQPARRAAGYWRLWAESNGVVFDAQPCLFAVAADDEAMRTRLWSDATLGYSRASVPEIFDGGSLADVAWYEVTNDVVLHPSSVITELRAGLQAICLSGEIVRTVIAADSFISHVQVEVDGEVLAIVPRFVVLAAGAGNAAVLGMIGKRFHEQSRRKESQELARSSQSIRRTYVVCLEGPDLPAFNGHAGDLTIVSYPATSGGRTWLVSPPPRDTDTVLGPDDLRFPPTVEAEVVADVIDRLFRMSPKLAGGASELRWSCYAGRRAQHPMLAADDTTAVAQPVPAKLEAFGLDGFLALWPSHLGYAMVLGDVVAERVGVALAESDEDAAMRSSDSTAPRAPLPEPKAKWEQPDFEWSDWPSFSSTYDIKVS